MHSFWSRWKKITSKIADLQANIILSIIYISLIIPIGQIRKIFSPNNKKNKKSYWIKKQTASQDLEWARRQ